MDGVRKRSPRENKALDYQRQRRGFAEYHHAMRGGKWRRNRRRPAQQVERQAERRAVDPRTTPDLHDPGFDPAVPPRRRIGKRGASTLAEWILRQRAGRRARAGRRRRP